LQKKAYFFTFFYFFFIPPRKKAQKKPGCIWATRLDVTEHYTKISDEAALRFSRAFAPGDGDGEEARARARLKALADTLPIDVVLSILKLAGG